jgi:hypothetical protein
MRGVAVSLSGSLLEMLYSSELPELPNIGRRSYGGINTNELETLAVGFRRRQILSEAEQRQSKTATWSY